MKEGSNSMAISAVFMVIATVMAKALGLVRDMLVASNYGTGVDAIAYDAASRLPILLFDFIIGGVVTAAFIPIFNELLVKRGKDSAFRFADSYITLILIICIVISLLGLVFAELLVEFFIPDVADVTKVIAVKLTRIMFPMVIFTGLAFAYVGVLLSLGEFRIPAIISLVSNSVIVFYLFTLDKIYGVVGLSLSMVIGWMLQAFVQVPKLCSLGYRYRPRFEFGSVYIKQAASGAIPILLGTWTGPVCSIINTRFASGISEGRAVTALGYANRFYTIIIGVFSYVATNLLFPYISKATARGEKEEANKLMISSVRILMLVIIPITAGIAVLSPELVTIVYKRGEFSNADVLMTSSALTYYTAGMMFAAVNEVLTKAFFARKAFKVPMYSSMVAMVANFALVGVLRDIFGIGGIALSSAAAVAIGCVFNYFALLIKDKVLFVKKDVFALVKMLISAALMAIVVWLVSGAFESALIKLIIGVCIGVLVYFLLCFIFRLDEIKMILNFILKRNTEKQNDGGFSE